MFSLMSSSFTHFSSRLHFCPGPRAPALAPNGAELVAQHGQGRGAPRGRAVALHPQLRLFQLNLSLKLIT